MSIPKQTIDLAAVDAWPLLAKGLACVLVAVLTGIVGYVAVLAEDRSALAAAKAETQRQSAELQRKRALAASPAAAATARNVADAVFAELLEELPARAEVPGLLESIAAAATAEGLAVVRIELGTEQPVWLGGPPGSETEEAQPAPYLALPIAIEVVGGYHELGAFGAGLAALPRLVTVGDFTLRNADDNPAELALTLAASTYRLAETKP